MPTALTPADFGALAHLARRRRQLLFETFGPCKLKIGAFEHVKQGKDVVDGVKAVKSSLGKIGGPVAKAQAESTLKEIFGGMDWVQVVPLLGPAMHEVAKEVSCFLDAVPCLGSIESGAKAVYHFGQAARRAWQGHRTDVAAAVFRSVDPKASCAAVKKLIDRVRNENLVKGSINATHAATTAGMFFVDGGAISGPVAGAAKQVANLCQSLYLWARDIREMIEGNRALGSPENLSADMFKASPVLGAYLMTESNTSDMLDFMIADIGLPGWMDKVEQLLPDFNHVQDMAGRMLRGSRLELEGLRTDFYKVRGLTRWEKFTGKVSKLKERLGHAKDAIGIFR